MSTGKSLIDNLKRKSIPFSLPDPGRRELEEIASALSSGWITTGLRVKGFEERLETYWPTAEERRRALAKHYEARGIAHPRIELWPEKVWECDFKPIVEAEEYDCDDYCAF